MPYKIITEEIKQKKREYFQRYKALYPEKVRESNRKLQLRPERREKENLRVKKRYLEKKEFERLKPLGDFLHF